MGIAGVVMAAAAVAQGVSQYEAADARKRALDAREQQEETAANQRSIQRSEQLKKVIGAQEALAGERGYSPASPSFQAIQSNTFDEWAADERASKLSLAYGQEGLEAEKSAQSAAQAGAIIGTGATLFSIGANYAGGGSGGAPQYNMPQYNMPGAGSENYKDSEGL